MNISAIKRKPVALYAFLAGNKLFNSLLIRQLMRISGIVTITLLTTFEVLLATSGKGQNMATEKVTIGLQHESLMTALKKIEEQTPLRFFYRKADIKILSNLNLPAGTRTVEETLSELLQNTFFSFRQIDGNILLERNGQIAYEIKGRLLDNKHQPVVAATVKIVKTDINKIIQSTQADTGGFFSLSVQGKGEYLIKISAIGMDSLSVRLILGENASIKIPDIILIPSQNHLKEVSIVGKKPTIELLSDRMIFNIGNLINTVGDNALDALKKAPGVTVSFNDGISLRGDQGVQIMINGRQTYLNGSDLANVLKAIPASDIDQIEIITNPSAKFDAAGTAGIINIKLKKNKNLGFNGNANINGMQGYTFKFNGSAQGNYRTDKVDLYGSYNYSDYVDRNKSSTLRSQLINQIPTVSDQHTEENDEDKSHSYRAGVDYFINSKSTLGFLFTGSNGKDDDRINGSTAIYHNKNQLDSLLTAQNNRFVNRNNYNTNINYQYTDTTGKTLNVNFNNIILDRRDTSLQPNTYTDASGNLLQKPLVYYIDAPTKINIVVANIDYEQKLFKGKLGIGAKFSSVDSKNDFNSYNVINGENQLNPDLTNFFNYKEKINAGYINYNKTLKKWSYQIGLRGEQTISDGNLTTLNEQGNERVKTKYFNLFPNISIGFKQDDHNSFSASYSRRIERPNYQNLNPFVIRLDELTSFQGNPFLKAQYSNNIELNYAWQQYLIVSVSYKETNNIVAPITDSAQNNHLIESYQNIGRRRSFTFSLSSSLDITKWWSLYINASIYNQAYNGDLHHGMINNKETTFMTSGQTDFKLSPTISTEVSFFYRTPEVNGIYRNSSAGEIDLGFKKTFLQDRATIRLSYNDVFHMLRLTSYSNYGGLNIIGTQQPESQIFKVGLAYRFGNNQVKAARNRSKGSEDESGRL